MQATRGREIISPSTLIVSGGGVRVHTAESHMAPQSQRKQSLLLIGSLVPLPFLPIASRGNIRLAVFNDMIIVTTAAAAVFTHAQALPKPWPAVVYTGLPRTRCSDQRRSSRLNGCATRNHVRQRLRLQFRRLSDGMCRRPGAQAERASDCSHCLQNAHCARADWPHSTPPVGRGREPQAFHSGGGLSVQKVQHLDPC